MDLPARPPPAESKTPESPVAAAIMMPARGRPARWTRSGRVSARRGAPPPGPPETTLARPGVGLGRWAGRRRALGPAGQEPGPAPAPAVTIELELEPRRGEPAPGPGRARGRPGSPGQCQARPGRGFRRRCQARDAGFRAAGSPSVAVTADGDAAALTPRGGTAAAATPASETRVPAPAGISDSVTIILKTVTVTAAAGGGLGNFKLTFKLSGKPGRPTGKAFSAAVAAGTVTVPRCLRWWQSRSLLSSPPESVTVTVAGWARRPQSLSPAAARAPADATLTVTVTVVIVIQCCQSRSRCQRDRVTPSEPGAVTDWLMTDSSRNLKFQLLLLPGGPRRRPRYPAQ